MADGPVEAEELERAADWRIRKIGENPVDTQSAAAAKLLQKLAEEVRGLRGSPVYTEYLAILNWLRELDGTEAFAERARSYPSPIGIKHFPGNAEAYLLLLIPLAKGTPGTY